MRRFTAVAAMAVVAMGVSACAQIPMTGAIQEGVPEQGEVSVPLPIAQGPVSGAGPEAIVSGFIEAAAAGVATDFDAARSFLTDATAASWNPGAQVSVYGADIGLTTWDEATTLATVGVPVSIRVDESGRRTDTVAPEDATFEFELAQVAGEWRIAELSDGVVLSTAEFTRYFGVVNLYFVTPAQDMAVPDLRWLPRKNAATSAARELIEGPAEWLADAVDTGFLPGSQLAVEAVVLEDSIAKVDLTPGSVGSDENRALVYEQLRLTLTQLPNVSGVEVTAGGLPIVTQEPPQIPTEPESIPAVAAIVGNRLALYGDGELLITTPTAGVLPAGAGNLALAFDGTTAAFTTGIGAPGVGVGVYVTEALAGGLVALDDAAPEGLYEAQRVYEAADAIRPSFDRYGSLWTASDSMGGVVAIDPSGEAASFDAAWLAGRSIVALALSPGGTRIAVVTRSADVSSVQVAAVVRDTEGRPLSIGDPFPVAVGVTNAVDVDWDTEVAVGVSVSDVDGAVGSQLWVSNIGGDTSSIPTPTTVVDFAMHGGEQAMVYVDDERVARWRADGAWGVVFENSTSVAFSG